MTKWRDEQVVHVVVSNKSTRDSCSDAQLPKKTIMYVYNIDLKNNKNLVYFQVPIKYHYLHTEMDSLVKSHQSARCFAKSARC